MKTPHLKLLLGGLVILATFTPPPPASAKLIWQDFSLSLLSGSNYEKQKLPNGIQTQSTDRNVVTFEHASGHTWGGTFLFIDRLMSRDSDFENDAMYGEFSINPTMFKPGGFVKQVYAATQWEFGSGDNGKNASFNLSDGNSFNNYLLGVGVNLAVPKASFFNVAFYRRFNDDQTLDAHIGNRTRDDNEQLTVVWRFDLADGKVRFDGFLDAVTAFDFSNGDKSESGFNFTPQLKYDIGSVMGMQPKKLWGGVEYVYWENKFGNKDWDERNLNLLLKWHF
ncbi:DUF5020 domain-containing protein [Candidatus Spongiihabitans sp.]|uniref:DUF5020 domain-containing protein n=1 Tax=Candidatus Spongiihabitans sp. TaxID=3101308 RepID=UPI003C7CF72A